MKKSDLVGCFTKIDLDDNKRQVMLNQLLKERRGEAVSVKRFARKLSAAAVAVIAVCALTVSTALAVSLGWHEKLIERLKPSQEQMETMEPAVGMPGVSVTEHEVTVRVLQTMSDARGIYVLYEVEMPADSRPDNADWRFMSLYVETAENPQGSGFGQISNEILAIEGDTITMLFHLTQTDPLTAGRAFMDFSDLLLYRDGALMDTIQGIWRLEWDFIHSDSVNRVIALNQEIVLDDARFTINRVIISPISISIFGEGDIAVLEWEVPVIHFADGAEISFRERINSLISAVEKEQEGLFSIEMYYPFDQLIDVPDVVDVTVGGDTITLP